MRNKTKIRKRLIAYIVILIILLITLTLLYFHDKNIKEDTSQELELGVQSFLEQLNNESGNSEILQEIDSASLNQNTNEESTTASKVAKIGEHTILGIIRINKIGIQYPIISYVNENSMSKTICKYTKDKKLNDTGNVTIIGHNMRNGLIFRNLDKLNNDDIIEIMDATGQVINYKVSNMYTINPYDKDCLKTTDETKREITIITCVTGNFNKRLVVKAIEII